MFNRIIVVCTGNICRSPIGEGLLKARLKDRNLEICSAGTGALIGHPADPLAVEVAADHGLDISMHRAQQATQPLLSSMDLILTLDNGHSDWINARYPQLRGRVHKIMKWNENADVADPYRQPKAAFEQAWTDIETGIDAWLQKIG
ncbi:low molecular weight protein-tyrosine-phosphatase [Solimonas marina]|uniref:protein-tyrosine-phosphatase n=1 Tax=Solimonas marina TaxID=2714601 RepID=A0A969W9H3_9GAMM|nr:low molecular weight protein-tyrosine-phosphatase [Solimonas marina]NKF22827.1 low molecular weight phosphotyrosine protein phosphatase [Solimonas marina]